jgi:sporulation protein YlmC with PRC-barrel domain
MTRTIAWALALSTAIATPVLAQNANQPAGDAGSSGTMVKQPDKAAMPATGAAASGSFMTQAQEGQWRASKLVGVDIYNNNNENIGEVNEILVDASGKIDAVIVGVGGFLGIGEKNVALPFDAVKWQDQPVRSAANTNPPANSTANPPAAAPMAPAGNTAATDTTGAVAGNNTMADTARRDYPDHGLVDMSKDQLKSAPEFKYNSQK